MGDATAISLENLDAQVEGKSLLLNRARQLVLAHGWNTTSYQILNPGIRRWFSDRADAVIGFDAAARVRVVAGAPVCASERLEEIAGDFERDAGRNKERVCYFAAES